MVLEADRVSEEIVLDGDQDRVTEEDAEAVGESCCVRDRDCVQDALAVRLNVEEQERDPDVDAVFVPVQEKENEFVKDRLPLSEEVMDGLRVDVAVCVPEAVAVNDLDIEALDVGDTEAVVVADNERVAESVRDVPVRLMLNERERVQDIEDVADSLLVHVRDSEWDAVMEHDGVNVKDEVRVMDRVTDDERLSEKLEEYADDNVLLNDLEAEVAESVPDTDGVVDGVGLAELVIVWDVERDPKSVGEGVAVRLHVTERLELLDVDVL